MQVATFTSRLWDWISGKMTPSLSRTVFIRCNRPHGGHFFICSHAQDGKLECRTAVYKVICSFSPFPDWAATTKTTDSENPEGRHISRSNNIFAKSQLASIRWQLTLAFNHFPAHIFISGTWKELERHEFILQYHPHLGHIYLKPGVGWL